MSGRREDPQDLDELREVLNQGFCRSSWVLADMLNGPSVIPEVPRLRWVPVPDIMTEIMDPAVPVVGLYVGMRDGLTGGILLCFERGAALRLAGKLCGEAEVAGGELSPLAVSALRELANILVNLCVNALAEHVGETVFITVPAIAQDTFGAVIDALIISLAERANRTLVVDTALEVEGQDISGVLVLLPTYETLARLGVAKRRA